MLDGDKERKVSLLLLAAGGSRRLGEPKQLLIYEGETLLRRAARTALASLCRPVVVVLGAHAEKMKAEIDDLPLETVVNETWASGMASSIRAGLQHLDTRADTHAIIIMLCDQPLISTATINLLISTYHATGAPLVAASYEDTRGVPAIFDRQLYPALRSLTGAQGAKMIIANSTDVVQIPVPEAALDIDTLTDYGRLVTI